MSEMLLDRAGRRRSPATMPGFHAGRPPHNKGLRYPADPPKVEEIVAVIRTAGDNARSRRLRGLIVVLWRAGLRIQEALGLAEADLDYRRGALLVRRGKGGRRREVGMDSWGWDELQPWLELRVGLPVGPLFCVLNGRTRGRQWSTAAARAELRRGGLSGGPPTIRPASAAARPRRRDGSRRRTARRHPTAARPQQPRHHLGLPPRHRQRRDHRHRPHSPRADDPGQHVPSALIELAALLVAQSSALLTRWHGPVAVRTGHRPWRRPHTRSTTAPPPPPPTARLSASAAAARP
jgi:hypothetical protein